MSDKFKNYKPTIGIECHVQLKTKTKLFAAVENDAREAPPNTLISHICMGMPGALPVLNEEAVKLAVKAGYALKTRAQKFSRFDRKHYFYPDLPKGYQISQLHYPIILGGEVEISLNGEKKTIGITRAHLEEDAGKNTHPAGKDYSLVDLNRAGTPLLEIVSEPEINSPVEAKAYAKELYTLMRYAEVSDANLFYGNMRFDVNVSVSKTSKLGNRTETKNLNSFKSVEKAVEYEIKRQIKELEKGRDVTQETRGWDDAKQRTFSQRSKEDAHDYRYFPDPDLPPIELSDGYISSTIEDISPMPFEWREKLAKLGLSNEQIELLIEASAEFDASYLELITKQSDKVAKVYANWIINTEVPTRRALIEDSRDAAVKSTNRKSLFKEVIKLQNDGKLSSNNVKRLLVGLLFSGELPEDIETYATDAGYIQMSDSSQLENIVDKVLNSNRKAAKDVKNGEMKAIGFLVGQVMKESKGQANPSLVQKIIKKKLS